MSVIPLFAAAAPEKKRPRKVNAANVLAFTGEVDRASEILAHAIVHYLPCSGLKLDPALLADLRRLPAELSLLAAKIEAEALPLEDA